MTNSQRARFFSLGADFEISISLLFKSVMTQKGIVKKVLILKGAKGLY